MDYWFRGKDTVVAYVPDREREPGVAGAFYLKPNWPACAAHVANAGFIVAPQWRGKGLGRLLARRCWSTRSSLAIRLWSLVEN
jgi:GNAT superfamily N-acetyltransferase